MNSYGAFGLVTNCVDKWVASHVVIDFLNSLIDFK